MILDTNALSAFADGDESLRERLREAERLVLPAVVLGEFRYGIARSRHRAAYERWLKDLLRGIEVLDVTDKTASVYAELRVELKRLGRPVPANDAWIAALGLQHRLPILTRDRHFDAVSDLARISW